MMRSLHLRKQKHHLDFDNEAAMHVQSIELCLSDLFRAFEYVEPHDDNRKVFSHRFYELLLRGCTEFESLSKHILSLKGETIGKTTIKEYFKLTKHFDQLKVAGVVIQIWNPNPIQLLPFDGWTAAKGPSWYRDYNSVKHSRLGDFEKANLENAAMSIAAVITLLSVVFGERVFNFESELSWSGPGMHFTGTDDKRIVLCRKMPKNLVWDGAL